jgi:nitroimidazol reductase NimA-like FMN-containing flavoprotein (pyridoxamine 5'-phosphate oxidase superfamily)
MVGRLSDEEIDRLLREQTIGHLGCSAHGRTYVLPMSFVYHDGTIYGHTAEGLKLQMLRSNPEVCFQVDAIAGVSSWRSAVTWGRFEILDGENGAAAMRHFLKKLQPHLSDVEGAREQMLEQLVALSLSRGFAYRIVLREKSGRYEA